MQRRRLLVISGAGYASFLWIFGIDHFRILPKIIGRFREKYPLVSVMLTIADTNEIEGRVLEGDLELGVIGSMSIHKSLIHHKLWNDELVLTVPSRHRWAKKKVISLQES